MAEVYAVSRATAPSPAGAYPVWHEYVGAISVASFDMQPHGLGALAGATPAIEHWRHKDGGNKLVTPPAVSQFGRQGLFLLLNRRRLGWVGNLHSTEFWLGSAWQ
jgi:hypothetical protein